MALSVAGLLVLIQLGFELVGGYPVILSTAREFGLSRMGMMEGKLWQPVSYALIHGSWLHLAINVFGLLAFGSRIERIGGGRQMLILLVGGWLVAGLFYLLLGGQGTTPLVGISGGVVSLLLWLTGVSPDSRMWPVPVSGRNLGLGILVASALLTLMNPGLGIPGLAACSRALGMGAGNVDVAHACHLGGAVFGLAAARWTLRPRATLETLQRDRARREAKGSGANGGS
ncbi:MAG: rhomboid family intramembrane serine protease [Verrucomicrobiota bacterium]